MPTLEERIAALEARVTPEGLRWVCVDQTHYRLECALPGQSPRTLLVFRKDGNGTWAMIWGDITPVNDSGIFDTNYVRGMPDAMWVSREAGSPYATTEHKGNVRHNGANDGTEISGFLSGNADRDGPYTAHAGAQLKINGESWDPLTGIVLTSMMVFHTEELSTPTNRPGLVSLYTGAKNDPGDLKLAFRAHPGGVFTTKAPVCSVYNSFSQPTVDGSEVRLTWDREEADNFGMHDMTQPTRLYARVAGTYRAWAAIAWSTPPTGLHSVSVRRNGVDTVRGPGSGGYAYVGTDFTMALGDWVDVWTYQSGSAPNVHDSSRAGIALVAHA